MTSSFRQLGLPIPMAESRGLDTTLPVSSYPPHTLWGHEGWMLTVAFSPDGQLLASAGGDRTARLWRVADGQPLYTLRHTGSGWVLGIAFSPDGRLLATAGGDGTVCLWHIQEEEQ